MKNNFIKYHRGDVCRTDRERKNKHKSVVLWFSGLSGAGKSTIAHKLEKILHDRGIQSYVFDGDNVRHGLCNDLCFSPEDRTENIRRIAETAKLFCDAGIICLCAFITPLKSDRDIARKIIGDDFKLVHIKCPVGVCEERDIKGYYKKARAGVIKNYTGISAPYDAPDTAELTLCTDCESLDESVAIAMDYLDSLIALD